MNTDMKNSCVEISVCGEKVYRLFLDIIKAELGRLGLTDINPVQALTLLNIDDSTITIGDLTSKGYYTGSNASYNIDKMSIFGYVSKIASEYDKRASCIKLSDKGNELCDKLAGALGGYSSEFEFKLKNKAEIERNLEFIRRVEQYWREKLPR
jgi:DNA-binding MarR family transcriptional regulator